MAAWAARLPGLLCALGTLWLLYRIIRRLVPASDGAATANLFALLYLANPLILQQSLMLDIDNTVVTLTCVLFLHEFLRLDAMPRHTWGRYVWWTVLMALTFWAKEFSAAYLTVAILMYLLLQRRWATAAAMIGVAVAGAALFWATWLAYCRWLDLPAMYFIRFTILGKLAIGEGLLTTIARGGGWMNAWYSVGFSFWNTALWLSPFYAVLVGLVTVWRGLRYWQTRRLEPWDLLLLYGWAVLGATQVYRPSGWFLKYQMPAMGVLLALVAAHVQTVWAQRPGRPDGRLWVIIGALAVVVAFAQTWMTGDPVQHLFSGGLPAMGKHNVWTFYIVGLVALLFVVKVTHVGGSLRWVTATALLAGALGSNLGLTGQQLADKVTSISWNNYGETGFRETVEYLRANLPADELVICRKDFGFHLLTDTTDLYRRWYNPVVITNVRTGEELVRNITAPGVTRIVLDRYSIRQDTLPILQQFYGLEKQIGSFYVLKRVRFS
jgi:4-amino-4-deoxy-L-arabinose transferase-like glycosyltransferase